MRARNQESNILGEHCGHLLRRRNPNLNGVGEAREFSPSLRIDLDLPALRHVAAIDSACSGLRTLVNDLHLHDAHARTLTGPTFMRIVCSGPALSSKVSTYTRTTTPATGTTTKPHSLVPIAQKHHTSRVPRSAPAHKADAVLPGVIVLDRPVRI